MPKRHKISDEELKAIAATRRRNKDKAIEKRLEVLVLHAEGKKHGEIAEKTGFGKAYVSQLVQEYVRFGLEHYSQKHHAGNRRNMSFEEEKALLAPFSERAAAGQLVTVAEILAAYERRLGRPAASNSQIYNVLARHGWRKVMPRSRHPNKASDEAISASKKLTNGWTNCELSTGKKTAEV